MVVRVGSGFRFLFGQKGIPRFARLDGLVSFGQFGWAQGDGDQMIARGALNLFPGELFVGLQVLLAVRTGEFELAHKPGVFVR
jgi:hypothetical protein